MDAQAIAIAHLATVEETENTDQESNSYNEL